MLCAVSVCVCLASVGYCWDAYHTQSQSIEHAIDTVQRSRSQQERSQALAILAANAALALQSLSEAAALQDQAATSARQYLERLRRLIRTPP